MTLHQAAFSITTDAFGYGEDDLRLRPVSATRTWSLTSLTFETDDGGGNPSLTLRELDEDEDSTGAAIYTDGDQLFFITTPYGSGSDHQMRSPTYIQPRTEAYEEDGTWISAADAGDILSTSRWIRLEVNDGGSTKTYTGKVFYETAGDYRF